MEFQVIELLKADDFQTTYREKKISLFSLKNHNGTVVQITNYGAKIASIFVTDKNGNFEDVVLGYDTIEKYIHGHEYYGAICGRYANRIAGGKMTIDGITYQLPVNNGPNHLHGGPEGFSNKVFNAETVVQLSNSQSILMSYFSPEEEMGYPGNLKLQVNYTLTDDNELQIDYFAETDKATHINICSHSYFNLAGAGSGDILNHELSLNADFFTPLDANQIPTGELKPVENTPMDFLTPEKIGKNIDTNDDQLMYGKGYDHNWVLNKKGHELSLAATLYEPESGRKMEVYTTQPGIQIYTGNFIDNDKGKNGKIYKFRGAVCLETQHFPDSPNKTDFPSTLLRPEEKYQQTCIYKFLTQ